MTKVNMNNSEPFSDGEEKYWEDDMDSPQESGTGEKKTTRHYSSRLIIEPLRVFKDRSLQQSIRNVIRKNIVQLLQTDKVEQELIRIVERKVDKRQNHPEEYEELQKRLKWFKTLIQSYKGLRKRLQKYYAKIATQAQEGKGNQTLHAQLQQQLMAQQQRATLQQHSMPVVPQHTSPVSSHHYLPQHPHQLQGMRGSKPAAPSLRSASTPTPSTRPLPQHEESPVPPRLSPLLSDTEDPLDGGMQKRSNSPPPLRSCSTMDYPTNVGHKRATPMPTLPSLSSLFPNLPPPTPSVTKSPPSMVPSADSFPPAKRQMVPPPAPVPPMPSATISAPTIPPMPPMPPMPGHYNPMQFVPFLQGMPQPMMPHPLAMPTPTRPHVFSGPMPPTLPLPGAWSPVSRHWREDPLLK